MKKYKDEDWLTEQYVNKNRSTVEIGDEMGVAASTVNYWLKKFNIDTRNLSEAQSGRELSEESKNKISESVSEHIEENGHPFEGESHTDEARERMSESKKGKNNHFYGKNRPEQSKRMKGENNPAWKGGVTSDMDFRKSNKWQNFSFKLKEKFDWECQNCGSHGSESEIHTHHAIPVSKGGNEFRNVFIVLCKKCHKDKYSFWHNSEVSKQINKIEGKSIDMKKEDIVHTEVM